MVHRKTCLPMARSTCCFSIDGPVCFVLPTRACGHDCRRGASWHQPADLGQSGNEATNMTRDSREWVALNSPGPVADDPADACSCRRLRCGSGHGEGRRVEFRLAGKDQGARELAAESPVNAGSWAPAMPTGPAQKTPRSAASAAPRGRSVYSPGRPASPDRHAAPAAALATIFLGAAQGKADLPRPMCEMT